MSALIRYLAESGLCLVLFYAAYWFLMRRETTFILNRLYLLGSILLSLTIPLLKVPSPFRTAALSSEPLDLAPLSAPAGRHFDPVLILIAIYIAGALLFLARFARQLFRLYRLVKGSEGRDLDGLKLISVEKDFAPFSFLRYVFLNSQSFDPIDLRHILVHERAHVRQGHTLDILLVECVTILQWFNPIVRPYKKSIQETHEFLADGEVIAQGFNSASYRLLMLEQQVGFQLLKFSNNFKQSQIKRRIVMMSQIRSKGAARLKVLLLLPLAVLLVLALAQPRPSGAADHALVSGLAERSDPGQDETQTKERIVKATENLAVLKDKEAKVRQALDSTTDPEKQRDLEKSLQVILELRKATEAYLKNPETVPPPPPLPPPAPDGKAGLKMLKEKEDALRKQLASETDPAKQQELKETLDKVLMKQKDLQARLAAHEPPPPPPPPIPPDKEALYRELQAKEAAVLAEMEKTQDSEKIAKLKETVDKLRQKQAQLKAETGASAAQKNYSIDDLNKIIVSLQEKEKDTRAELERTQDAQKVAELKDVLHKIQAKQEAVKAKLEDLKKIQDEKK